MTYILKVGLFNLRHFRSPLLSGSEADRYIQFITLTLIITSSLPHSPSPSPSLSLAYVLEYSDWCLHAWFVHALCYNIQTAIEVIEFVKSKNIEIRFSSEDSFRSDLVDLLSIYQAVDKIGVNRVGIADTVGCANPRQVYDLVRTLRGVVSCDIETHFHNDSGCGESLSLSLSFLASISEDYPLGKRERQRSRIAKYARY